MRPWIAQWITAETTFAEGEFHRIAFRRDVDLESVPASLQVRISADARYVLWINGEEIGRGPVRAQPSRWTYDTYDIARAMRPGDNVIAVLVTYYGDSNANWQRANVTHGLGAQASMIFDAGPQWPQLASGANWEAAVQRAWTTVPNDGKLAALPIEILDYRVLDDSWRTVSRRSGRMPAACVTTSTHPGGITRGRPPAFPFGRLAARSTAPLSGDLVLPTGVVRLSPPPAPGDAVVASVHRSLRAVNGQDGTRVSLPERAYVEPDAPQLWQIDFGRVITGITELDIHTPAGTVVDLAYLERPLTPGEETRYVPRAGARIITSDERVRYRSLESNGFRYIGMLVRSTERGTFSLERVAVHEQLSRFEGRASFTSSDAELNRLWKAGVRTVQVNSTDALTDCPTREQRAWVGDAVVHTSVHLVANTDWRLIERYLELADSPRPDGLLPMSVAGDIEADGGFSIPDWSLHWLHALWLYARSSRKAAFVRRRMWTAARMLQWFEDHATPDGVLQDVPEWVLIDWSSVSTAGRSAALTALWARGLREFADLSEWLGNIRDATRARRRFAEVECGFEQFWDASRGVYIDNIHDGVRLHAVSQATNAAAIVAGIVKPERAAAIIETITDERRLVTRGWNAASPSVSLAQKIRDRAEGIQRIDWDVDTEIVRAEPFFSSVVHDAVASAGRADLIPHLVRRWSRFLKDGYDTFGECWEWGTPCHGWSSTPTHDLVVHMLGVRPLGFSTDEYLIAPARTTPDHVHARIPTRAGLLEVKVIGPVLDIDAPLPVRVVLWTGGIIELSPGAHRVDLDHPSGRILEENDDQHDPETLRVKADHV